MLEIRIKRDNKAYCKGILCNKENREIKCKSCGIMVCSVCSVGNECIDCYLIHNIDEVKAEFKEMLNDLELVEIITTKDEDLPINTIMKNKNTMVNTENVKG